MQGDIVFPAVGNNKLQGKIHWTAISNGAVANTSTVTAILYAIRPDGFGPTRGSSWGGYVKVGGSQQDVVAGYRELDDSWIEMARKENVVISHNADGSGSVTLSGKVSGPSGTSLSGLESSGSATITLEKISRYFSTTPTIEIERLYETSFRVKWSTSETCSQIVLKIGGTTYNTYSVNGTSGTIDVTGRTPNTSYSVQGTFTRKDSGLTTNSNTQNIKTFAYPSVTSVNSNPLIIGNTQTVNLYNPLERTISIYMKQNNTSGQTLKQLSTSSKTVVSMQANSVELYASIPNSKEGTAVYYCTYNDGATTHTSSTVSGKYKIKEDGTENPTFSNNFTYADTNSTTIALTGNNQIIVKDYSTVQVTIPSSAKATAKNSATMQKYQFGSEIKNYSASADVTFTPKTVSTNSLSVTAIDSRQLPTSATKPIDNWKEYFRPQITSATYERANNGSGTATTLRFSGTFWNDNFGTTANTLTATYGWKYSNSSASAPDWGAEWTDHDIASTDISINGNNFSGTVAMQGDLNAAGFSINQNFGIRVDVYDKISGREVEFTLTSATPAIAIYKSNVAIGQKYDTTAGGKLQVNGKISANDEIITTKALKIPNTSTDGYGLVNENGVSIIKDYNNNCVVLNATGAALFLGFQNTTSINILNGKATIDSNGNYSGKAANVTQVKSLSSKSHSNYGTNNDYLPDMSFIAYWNGAYSSGNASNLTYCYEGTIESKPKQLYYNASGSKGTITLSDAVGNYHCIDIYYTKENEGQRMDCTRIYWAQGKTVVMTWSQYVESGNWFQLESQTATLNQKQITRPASTNGYVNLNNGVACGKVTEVKIFYVDGWK